MIKTTDYISSFQDSPFHTYNKQPWLLIPELPTLIRREISQLDSAYSIKDEVAIHESATVEAGAILKGPLIIGPECFIAAHAYIRGGVYLQQKVTIGPSCEIKSSVLFSHTSIAHFNFIGDSIIGGQVNFEAGALMANHYNERLDKRIFIRIGESSQDIKVSKFGGVVGDQTRIGANSVLSPGTLLAPGTIIGRLVLIEQNPFPGT